MVQSDPADSSTSMKQHQQFTEHAAGTLGPAGHTQPHKFQRIQDLLGREQGHRRGDLMRHLIREELGDNC
jgi:hypothetical protein